MKLNYFAAAAAVSMLTIAGAAQAANVITYNDTPADTWNNYGNGNAYNPANTAVLTTDAGDQLYLRSHVTFQQAPASVGRDYTFSTGAGKQISIDWGIDTMNWANVSALITIKKYGGGGSFSFDPLATPDNKPALNGSIQNSFRMNWFSVPLDFDPTENASYYVELATTGMQGGPAKLGIDVNLGTGGTGAVPEPATWAMMIMGFGGIGGIVRSRRRSLALA